jgi:hypothetical protein
MSQKHADERGSRNLRPATSVTGERSKEICAKLLAGTIAMLCIGSCQEHVHPPFASDGDGGAARGAVVNPGVGVPNVSPGLANPSETNSPDATNAVEQTLAGTGTSTTNGTSPSTTFTSDAADATGASRMSTSAPDPFSNVTLAPVTLETSPPITSEPASAPAAGIATADTTDSDTSLNGATNDSTDLDGGTFDGGASSGFTP